MADCGRDRHDIEDPSSDGTALDQGGRVPRVPVWRSSGVPDQARGLGLVFGTSREALREIEYAGGVILIGHPAVEGMYLTASSKIGAHIHQRMGLLKNGRDTCAAFQEVARQEGLADFFIVLLESTARDAVTLRRSLLRWISALTDWPLLNRRLWRGEDERAQGDEDVPVASGVYRITHIPSGFTYIGSSLWMRYRWQTHVAALNTGKHPSEAFQHAYNKDGLSSFRVEVLETVEPLNGWDDQPVRAAEVRHIEAASSPLLLNVEHNRLSTRMNWRAQNGSRRKQRLMSQNDLAERSGVAKPNISRLERGKQQPRNDTIRRLADALDVPVDELANWEENSAEENP